MHRIVVGISGASGAVLGARIVELLAGAAPAVETHLVITKAGRQTMLHELGAAATARVEALASVVHPAAAIGSTIASGSFRTSGMIVAPCSVNSLSSIAHGLSSNLLTRAADVHLKERRPLVLLVRESPLHLGHLRSMAAATEMGAIIAPPVPAFYQRPQSLEEMVDAMARRAIDHLGLELGLSGAGWAGLDAERMRDDGAPAPARRRTAADSPR